MCSPIFLEVPAACTVPKRYDELVPGDRIVLPMIGGVPVIRTFSHGGPNGYVNRQNEPLWNVYYAEGSTEEWSGGNSGLPSHVCTVLVAEPCLCGRDHGATS